MNNYDQESGWRFVKRASGPILGAGLIAGGLLFATSADCDRFDYDECGLGEAIIGAAIFGTGFLVGLHALPMAIGGITSPYSSSKLKWIKSLPKGERQKEGELLLKRMSDHSLEGSFNSSFKEDG